MYSLIGSGITQLCARPIWCNIQQWDSILWCWWCSVHLTPWPLVLTSLRNMAGRAHLWSVFLHQQTNTKAIYLLKVSCGVPLVYQVTLCHVHIINLVFNNQWHLLSVLSTLFVFSYSPCQYIQRNLNAQAMLQ